MEERLKANDHKGGWRDCSRKALFSRLLEELQELKEVCINWPTIYSPKHIVHEAADVANFAMMLADNAGGLEPYKLSEAEVCKVCRIIDLLNELNGKDLEQMADYARELVRARQWRMEAKGNALER